MHGAGSSKNCGHATHAKVKIVRPEAWIRLRIYSYFFPIEPQFLRTRAASTR